ncbi:MAG: hypothetical protein HQL08_14580 [Nitrospirae bacterium]|nr:hypothetical protein [Nitrospirota bacterium]
MKNHVVAVAVAVLLLAAYGCSGFMQRVRDGNLLITPEQRHKVLSFFFDGVPLPGAADKPEERIATLRKEQQLDTMGTFRAHGPYEAKLCIACHSGGSNALLLPVEELCLYCHTQVISQAKKKLHGPVAAGGCKVCHNPHGSPYPFFLMEESKKFCFYCHNKDDVLKRDVHKQTQEQCTVCHSAHSSENEYLLKQ